MPGFYHFFNFTNVRTTLLEARLYDRDGLSLVICHDFVHVSRFLDHYFALEDYGTGVTGFRLAAGRIDRSGSESC